ncbi:Zn(2)-C6 fungal-type domain-containing protein [Favolaschia claudopus]|uniref:DNA-directed RNA polymerases I, II, and III subunit RPABC1 n=1 Tax=Favolaschia claudopus TaxID=2862362 RepID=A0AAW0BDE4_9AGAR
MSEQDETAKLWKVNRTIHELVKDRGFQVSDDEISMDLGTFRQNFASSGGSVDRNQLNFYTNSRVNPSDQIFVFFSEERNVGVKTMRKLLSILEEKAIQRGIIVFPLTMTSSARKVITAMAAQYRLEEFSESDLLVNIVHHTLVPRHEVLSPEDKKILLEKYRLKETQLPRIQLADPVARYYGLRRGQVVKITRPSETSGRYASYRIWADKRLLDGHPLTDDVHDQDLSSKSPVVRGARACTVCRAAKMKCVGADDGQKQCQRCKRANVECVFEKHRRGRKPGSKLSEASKMLRRLEKGLNSAKLKSQAAADADPRDPYQRDPYSATASQFSPNELAPLNAPPYQNGEYPNSNHGPRSIDDEPDDDPDPEDRALFPAKLIRKENQRNSFFRTILNPAEGSANPNAPPNRPSYSPPHQNRSPPSYHDPVGAGIIDEDQAKVLFDLIFLRLNPFINLFDPALHSVHYVRAKCPFLFTTLIMAGCKFFKPEAFKPCQKLAHEFAVRAFAEAWKRVEVVQAFACLTYWKDPDDNRTWTYIGYACRMAVELGLNRYLLERRNRERTYLVLFTHDRSLSIQTGRSWMLPEDEIVRHSSTWHEHAGNPPRPEDVIVAAQVQLRRISSETTDMFYTKGGSSSNGHNDVNYEVVLRNCNGKLTQWMDTWQAEMQRAGGESFHFSFLSLFRLHVRLFLNSFGIQASLSPHLSACCTSALDVLRIVSKDFPSMSMLRYGQDSITVMSAYAAVFLLRLLRSSNTLAQLHEGTAHEIHSLISKTADAYYDASVLSPASTSAAYHARFLRSLLANDIFKSRRGEPERYENNHTMPIDPRLQAPTPNTSMYPPQQISPHDQQNQQNFSFPASPTNNISPHTEEYSGEAPARNGVVPVTASMQPTNYAPEGYVPSIPHHASELDAHYWKNMFLELGFGDNQSEQARTMAQPPPPENHQLGYHIAPSYGH